MSLKDNRLRGPSHRSLIGVSRRMDPLGPRVTSTTGLKVARVSRWGST